MKYHLSFNTLGLAIVWLWTVSGVSIAEDRKSVLVIESYHASYQWDVDYTRAIRDLLSQTIDLTFFQLDTKRRPLSDHGLRTEQAWDLYLKMNPDLVIIGDDNALNYLGRRFANTDTPVVYLGINNNPRNYLLSRPKNITGILERPLLRRSLIYLLEVMEGSLGKVLILFDDGTTSKTVFTEVFHGNNQLSVGPIDAHIKLISSVDEWRDTITTAPSLVYDAIVVGLYHTITTANGEHVPEKEIINWSSSNTAVPLFGYWKFSVGQDMTVGGFVLDGYSQGELAATMALNVLNGESISLMPQSSGEGQFVFSRSQLTKWGINLPEGIAEKSTFLP